MPYVCYNRKEKKWVDDGKVAYVIKAVYETPIAKRGARSGYLKVKDLKKVKSRMSMRKRDHFTKEERAFAVLNETTLSLFKDADAPEDAPVKTLDVKTAKEITAKLAVGEMDAFAFTIEFEDKNMCVQNKTTVNKAQNPPFSSRVNFGLSTALAVLSRGAAANTSYSRGSFFLALSHKRLLYPACIFFLLNCWWRSI